MLKAINNFNILAFIRHMEKLIVVGLCFSMIWLAIWGLGNKNRD
nr:MAG TPA: hypothetical protein [Caudoviricetes sp.]